MTVTTDDLRRLGVDDQGSVSPVNTPYLDKFIPANHLKKGEHLKTPNGTVATADGGTTPKVHDGWMWDLTVPGNNDHDFYVLPQQPSNHHTYHLETGNTPVLVHNSSCGDLGPNWKPAPPSEIPCSTGCERVAAAIQAQIGGEIKTIEVDPGHRFQLGPYRGQDSGWYTHTVVVRDGRVYDGFSPRTGVPIDEYKRLFEYHDVINFGF